MPKLSIIIPVLNEEKSLPILLASIKSQDFTDYEIIVADSNSTDQTREVAESFGCKITTGGPPAIGRNSGAKEAQGQYLLFLDADVFLPRDFLEKIIAEAEVKQIDAASCGVVPLSDKNIDLLLHSAANAYISVTQYFYPHAPGCCILVKKTMHNKIGGFNEKLKLAEDHNYVSRIQKIGEFKILKNVKVFISVRRFESDGRFNVSAKYVLSELYRLMNGEIDTDIFKYKFGHHDDKKLRK